jgi:curved DNA-binding protein CbpA
MFNKVMNRLIVKYSDISGLRQASDILGISIDAPKTDIRKRYLQLVIENHPDKNPQIDPIESNRIMANINDAFRLLYNQPEIKQHPVETEYRSDIKVKTETEESKEPQNDFDRFLDMIKSEGENYSYPINRGIFEVYVQAGEDYLSIPEKNLRKFYNYKAYEIHITLNRKDLWLYEAIGDDRLTLKKNEKYRFLWKMPGYEYFERLGNVAGYVPKQIVKEMLEFLKEIKA